MRARINTILIIFTTCFVGNAYSDVTVEDITAEKLGLSEEDFVSPELAKKVALFRCLSYYRFWGKLQNGISVIIEPWVIEFPYKSKRPLGLYSVIITAGEKRPRSYGELVSRARDLYTRYGSVKVNEDGTFEIVFDRDAYDDHYSWFNPDEIYASFYVPINKSYDDYCDEGSWAAPNHSVTHFPYMEEVARTVLGCEEVKCLGYYGPNAIMVIKMGNDNGEVVYLEWKERTRTGWTGEYWAGEERVSDMEHNLSRNIEPIYEDNLFDKEVGPSQTGTWDFIDGAINSFDVYPDNAELLIDEYVKFREGKVRDLNVE